MNKRTLWMVLLGLLFLAGAVGSYFLIHKFAESTNHSATTETQSPVMETTDISVLRIYQPHNNSIEMTERKIPRRISNTAIAEAVIEEFFRPVAANAVSVIPQNVKLLGLYKDEGQMLYIDLSDEARRNFQGDAMAEYLLLKAIYESLVSNVPDFQDCRILIEGKEIESLGGHFYLKYALKNTFSADIKGEIKIADE